MTSSWDPLRADYIGLLCVRSDPTAQTVLAHAAAIPIASQWRDCLTQPRFHLGVDLASGGSGRPEDGPLLPILKCEPNGDVEIRVDTDQVVAAQGDKLAAQALAHLCEAIPAAACHVTLDRGDLLIIDNLRTLHARTAYEPRFDGTDRWLQRVSITTDLDRSSAVRTRYRRVIDNTPRLFN